MSEQREPSLVSLPSAINLLEHVQSFLLLSFHSLLRARGLYAPTTFLTTRALDLVVYQSRHPRVCSWLKDAVSSICAQLATGLVDKIVFAVISPPDEVRVIERWVFVMSSFPALPDGSWKMAEAIDVGDDDDDNEASNRLFEEDVTEQLGDAEHGIPDDEINWPNLVESLRGALRRLQITAEGTVPLPPGCTYTIAVELKEKASAPSDVSLSTCICVSRCAC